MMVKRTVSFAVAVALLATAASVQASESSRAATSDLPEAFLALGLDDSSLLTREEAQEVRGEGGFFWPQFHVGLFAANHLGVVKLNHVGFIGGKFELKVKISSKGKIDVKIKHK